MNEMVERVARAIECVNGGDCNGGGWADGKTCPTCVDVARAAIEELRNAPDEITAMMCGSAAIYQEQAKEIWRSMIDEALK